MVYPLEAIRQSCETLAACNLPANLPAGHTIARLVGDASTRSYFRITLPGGNTITWMAMPEPFDPEDFPYLQNYSLFRSYGVPLAEIYHMNPSRGWVFLQDLGDATVFASYHSWNDQTRLRYYLKALEYLRMIETQPSVKGLAFTSEKFLWELEFFREHFLFGLRGAVLSEQEASELSGHFTRLARELAERITVFSHRDYHSRNLMVYNDRLYVLDFQDARMGPATYDLASLCYDSYIQHPPDFLRHLERMFFTYHPDAEIQRYEYPRMCLQRNLKALGTFGYQAHRMGKDHYLNFVSPTLLYIKQHFEKLPEYSALKNLLAAHLPEL